MEQAITPGDVGDVNDSAPYLDLMEYVHTNVVPIQIATADAAYDFPLTHRVVGRSGDRHLVRLQHFRVCGACPHRDLADEILRTERHRVQRAAVLSLTHF